MLRPAVPCAWETAGRPDKFFFVRPRRPDTQARNHRYYENLDQVGENPRGVPFRLSRGLRTLNNNASNSSFGGELVTIKYEVRKYLNQKRNWAKISVRMSAKIYRKSSSLWTSWKLWTFPCKFRSFFGWIMYQEWTKPNLQIQSFREFSFSTFSCFRAILIIAIS
jgi:hypothetical protein